MREDPTALAMLSLLSYVARRMRRRVGAKLRGKQGQAMTEYVVLLFGCMLGLIVLLTPMRNAIHTYVRSIYFFVSLPFP